MSLVTLGEWKSPSSAQEWKTWGTFGKKGDQAGLTVLLKDSVSFRVTEDTRRNSPVELKVAMELATQMFFSFIDQYAEVRLSMSLALIALAVTLSRVCARNHTVRGTLTRW